MAGVCLGAPGVASAEDGGAWEVSGREEAPDPSWDVPAHEERPDASWDVPAREDRPDPSWDVTPAPSREDRGWDATPAPSQNTPPSTDGEHDAWAVEDASDEGAADGGAADAGAAPVRERAYTGLAPQLFERQRFTIRMTPYTGYRELLSLSIAWTRPDYFELELGGFVNPGQRRVDRVFDDEGALVSETERRVVEGGFYGRAGIAYPILDQRGVRTRPWHGTLLVPLELRFLFGDGDWTMLAALHFGAEFTRWFPGGMGLSLGALVGAPFFDLHGARAVNFEPIFRAHIGWAF